MSETEEGVYRATQDHLLRMQACGSLDELFRDAIGRAVSEALHNEIGWRAALNQSASELRMVRDVLEELGPVGCVKDVEQCLEPGAEGAALVEAIYKLAERTRTAKETRNAD